MHDSYCDAPAIGPDAGEDALMRADQRMPIRQKRRPGQRNGAKILQRLRTKDRIADRTQFAGCADPAERWHEHETQLERRREPGRKFDHPMPRHPPARLAQQQGAGVGERWTRQAAKDRVEVRAAGCVQDRDLERRAPGDRRPVERHRRIRRSGSFGRCCSLRRVRAQPRSSPLSASNDVIGAVQARSRQT